MVATQTVPQKFTASEIVLLAADDLTTAGNHEFSEWALTVAAWSRDRFRFGLRGYVQSYPDHKRVMTEIMGKKASSPVQQKYMEKIRPNHYKLTSLGKSVAARLRGGEPKSSGASSSGKSVMVKDLYEVASAFVARPQFRRWQENPEEPREWTGAAAFLGMGKDTKGEPAEKMEEVRTAIQAALDWCSVQEAAYLTRGSGQGGTPIHVRDLSELLDFLQALSYRFPEYLDKKNAKPKKRFD